jgi:hypothetical protein
MELVDGIGLMYCLPAFSVDKKTICSGELMSAEGIMDWNDRQWTEISSAANEIAFFMHSHHCLRRKLTPTGKAFPLALHVRIMKPRESRDS